MILLIILNHNWSVLQSQPKLIKNAAGGGSKKKSAKNTSNKKAAADAATLKATKKTTSAKPAANTGKAVLGRPKGSSNALKRRPSAELMTDDSENYRPEQPSAGTRGHNSKRMRMD